MRAKLWRGVSVLLGTAAALFLLSRLSAHPVSFRPSGSARLRLSWSARPERIETCRTLSAEELAGREAHMRQRIECEGRFATYLLRVQVDGMPVGEMVVRGGGFRHDRPIHLLRDLSIPPGNHRVRLSFLRRELAPGDTGGVTLTRPPASSGGEGRGEEPDTGVFAGRAQREVAERARRLRAAIPSRLELDTVVGFNPSRVILVTFNSERRTLELRTESDRTP